jgi:superfamily II DNA/RNA helicase
MANKVRPWSACIIHGGTPPDERAQMVNDFKRGVYRYLMNCNIATEGFDAPAADMIVLGRPTKSRSLNAQMVGRGTRVEPGLIDHLTEKHQAEERRRLIAASAKPNCLLLDFVGNCGRHSLATPVDALGGNYEPAVVELAKKKLQDNQGGDILATLKAAQLELKRIAQKAEVRSRSVGTPFDPFELVDVDMEQVLNTRFGKKPITPAQFALLDKQWPKKASRDALVNMTKGEASKFIDKVIQRSKGGLATMRQLHQLRTQAGVDDSDITFKDASAALDYVFGQRRAGQDVDRDQVARIIARRTL